MPAWLDYTAGLQLTLEIYRPVNLWPLRNHNYCTEQLSSIHYRCAHGSDVFTLVSIEIFQLNFIDTLCISTLPGRISVQTNLLDTYHISGMNPLEQHKYRNKANPKTITEILQTTMICLKLFPLSIVCNDKMKESPPSINYNHLFGSHIYKVLTLSSTGSHVI